VCEDFTIKGTVHPQLKLSLGNKYLFRKY